MQRCDAVVAASILKEKGQFGIGTLSQAVLQPGNAIVQGAQNLDKENNPGTNSFMEWRREKELKESSKATGHVFKNISNCQIINMVVNGDSSTHTVSQVLDSLKALKAD